ncbi:peptide/nickel transport system permease protein [Agromyces sp. 3263]|uniref:ABC transporter permease n=1 Tax=Agromyces sp. 3263 TaxID=2817750 RepID=UPI00285881E4|nr:ABC transporter permease [Agromyces sp. 3263]MDR6906632.1 peptide/nickel transport system permease protein [Agromyces sp. 3263]
MTLFILRRAMAGVVLVFVISTVSFLLISSTAADAARNMLGESATEAELAAKAAELGLDRPLIEQYLDWLADALQGDFGVSWFTSEPVTDMVSNRLPVTLSMVILAVLATAVISLVLGVTAAVRGGAVDKVLQFVSVIGFSLPNFWVALMLVLVFAVNLSVFPATGYVPFGDDPGAWALSLVLPVTALVVGGIASAAQQIRGAFLDVLEHDYVRTLEARGVRRSSLLLRHVLRNAAPPALTVLSLQFIGLLGGAVVIERIFAVPGLGTLTVNSSIQGDVPAIMGIVVVLVILVVVVNLVIDLASAWISPKARLQ